MILNFKDKEERTNILASLEQAEREYVYKNNTKWKSNFKSNSNQPQEPSQVLGAGKIGCCRYQNIKNITNWLGLVKEESE